MDTDKTLFFRELQRIADALEQSNTLTKEHLAISKDLFEQNKNWIEWNKAIRQENIEIEAERYKENNKILQHVAKMDE